VTQIKNNTNFLVTQCASRRRRRRRRKINRERKKPTKEPVKQKEKGKTLQRKNLLKHL
jgi:hypothetical protein